MADSPRGPASTPATSAKPATTPTSSKRSAQYALRMSHGWTVSDGTFDPIPHTQRGQNNVPRPSHLNHSYRSINGLTSLQLSYNAPISLCAMDVACQHLWNCMPKEVRICLRVPPPNGPALWSTNEEGKRAMYERIDGEKKYLSTNKDPGLVQYKFYDDLKKRPWVIWPLWVEDEWGNDYVTILWYSKATAQQEDVFDQLVSYAIIDPRRSPDPDVNQRHRPIEGRRDRIRDRFFEFLGKAGFNVQGTRLLNVFCSPMPLNEATSGERCFAVVKDLISQLISWYASGMKYDDNTTITSMSQWVNPYQERIEMAGINAWILMASLDFNARISVQAILPNTRVKAASNGAVRYLTSYDLAGPHEEALIAPNDYLLPFSTPSQAPPAQ